MSKHNGILITSDCHINPGESLPQYLLDMFHEAGTTGARAILGGDVLDFLPYGRAAWYTPEGQKTIKAFLGAIPKQGVDYIFGNHEGNIGWLEDMFKAYPQVRVARELNIFDGGNTWHFEHGHRWTYDWSWLQWIADDLTQFMVKYFPKQWTWFSKKMGWMPSGLKEKSAKYSLAVGNIWSHALKWSTENKTNLCIGHTHSHYDGISEDTVRFIDCGTKRVVRIG